MGNFISRVGSDPVLKGLEIQARQANMRSESRQGGAIKQDMAQHGGNLGLRRSRNAEEERARARSREDGIPARPNSPLAGRARRVSST